MHSLKGGCIVKEIPGLRISLVQVDSCCALAFDNAAQSERNGRFMAPIRRQQQTFLFRLFSIISPFCFVYGVRPYQTWSWFPRSHRGAWLLPCPSLH